jgi:hypothetical protein
MVDAAASKPDAQPVKRLQIRATEERREKDKVNTTSIVSG